MQNIKMNKRFHADFVLIGYEKHAKIMFYGCVLIFLYISECLFHSLIKFELLVKDFKLNFLNSVCEMLICGKRFEKCSVNLL